MTKTHKARANRQRSISVTIESATSEIGVNKEWRGEIGRIDEMMIAKYLDDNEIMNSIFYICGPPGMVDAMKKLLKKRLLIPKDRIRIEEFTGY